MFERGFFARIQGLRYRVVLLSETKGTNFGSDVCSLVTILLSPRACVRAENQDTAASQTSIPLLWFLSCCFSSFHSFSTLASTKSLEAYSQRMSCWSGHADNTTTFHAKGAWNVSAAKAADEESNSVCSKSSWTFRSPDPLHDDTHEYIADALQQMSLQDRDKVYHEVHGVGEVIEETPEFLKRSFVELQNELQLLIVRYVKNPHKLSSSNIQCDAFLKAQAQDHGYVHSPFHYKAFLRAERFDAKQAAIRMMRFFDTKAWCFGPIMSDDRYLSQDITQSMLSPEDMAVLRRGFNRVMTGRDRSGRCLYLNLPHFTHFESPESLVSEIVCVCTYTISF